MWEMLILTTILLLMFLGMRCIVDGKISARFQYALWLVVAVRLLFAWAPMPGSNISILPAVRDSVASITQMAQDVIHPDTEKDDGMAYSEMAADMKLSEDSGTMMNGETEIGTEEPGNSGTMTNGEMAIAAEEPKIGETTTDSEMAMDAEKSAADETMADNGKVSDSEVAEEKGEELQSGVEDATAVEKGFNVNRVLLAVYMIGVCILFVIIVLRNLLFYLHLRKVRIPYEGELPFTHIPGKVYLLEHTASPFLFGRNIYIAPEMPQDQKTLRYCLVHETCHYKQGDLLWSVIRNLCLVMYWYHPLVWLCVRLSDNDGELACDERAISVLGEKHRIDYGEILLALIRKQTWGGNQFHLSTQMSGSKRNVEKRMKRIAQKKKQGIVAVIFIMLGIVIALLSTFPTSRSDSTDGWSITEKEGFPAMIIDDDGNVVDFVRGELLHKIYFPPYFSSYYMMGKESCNISENAFSDCINLQTLVIADASNIGDIAENAFDGCPKDMMVYCEKDSYVWDYFQKKGFRVKEYVRDPDNLIGDWLKLGENSGELNKIAIKLTLDMDPDHPAVTKEEMRKVYGEPYFVMTRSGILPGQGDCESLLAYAHMQSELRFPKEATALYSSFPEYLDSLPDTITIPGQIMEIGTAAFQNCGIGQVEFEEGSQLEKIGGNAFMGEQFSTVTLPEGLKELGSNAFMMCDRLKEITIPASVEKIGENCFGMCGALETVTIFSQDAEFTGDPQSAPIFNNYMYSEETQDMVPNTKLTIRCYKGSTAETYAKKSGLQVEYLSGSPEDNKDVGEDTDSKDEWSNVTETEGFPAMIVDEYGNIVDFARGNLINKMCLNYYGNGYDRRSYDIKEKAFSSCSNLKTLIITGPGYIGDIARDAFEGCPKDMVVYCEEGSAVWSYFNQAGFRVEDYSCDEKDPEYDWLAFGENQEENERIAEKIILWQDSELNGEEIRKVYGEPYFVMTRSGTLSGQQDMDSLLAYSKNEIRFPKESKVLDGTFANCVLGTKKMTIPKDIEEIRGYDFLTSEILQVEFEEGSKLKNIGFRAFYGNSFATVNLPKGLKELGREAFYQCTGLKEITIPDSVKKIEEGCFGRCDSLETVTILSRDAEFMGDVRSESGLVFDKYLYSEDEEDFVPNTTLTIRCYKGSTAETYAKKLKLKVEYIEKD